MHSEHLPVWKLLQYYGETKYAWMFKINVLVDASSISYPRGQRACTVKEHLEKQKEALVKKFIRFSETFVVYWMLKFDITNNTRNIEDTLIFVIFTSTMFYENHWSVGLKFGIRLVHTHICYKTCTFINFCIRTKYTCVANEELSEIIPVLK